MQRNVFERHSFEGFRTSKVESVSLTTQGKRLFAGTSEGNLVLYENKIENTPNGIKIHEVYLTVLYNAYLFFVFSLFQFRKSICL